MRQLKHNKTDHKIHLIFGTNCYMFRYQGAIYSEFIKNKGR